MNVTYLRPRDESLPHNVEAEQQLLGAVLVGQSEAGSRIGAIMAAGGADLFFDPIHRNIFEVAQAKDARGELVSPVSIKGALEADEGMQSLGGAQYLARLAGAAVSSSAFHDYIALLADARARRELVSAARQAIDDLQAGEDPPGDVAGRLEAQIVLGSISTTARKPVSMMAAVTKALDAADRAFRGEEVARVPSGLPALDSIMGGFYGGDMVILGGRPSMGKTAVALSIALNAARAGHGVVIASLEMTPDAMAFRALSEASANSRNATPYTAIRTGQMREDQMRTVAQAAREVAELPIAFLSREFSDIGALYGGVRRALHMMPKGKMPLILIDYLQLLRSGARSRYEQITEISIAVKGLAMRLGAPVVALSQLSRQVEQRDDKRPMLSDLRESGQLEQDADSILFCYRDEYYLERQQPDIADEEEHAAWRDAMERAKNRLEVIVAKQRQGQIGTAHMRFNPALNLIWEV